MKREIIKIIVSGILGILIGIASLFGVQSFTSCSSTGSANWDAHFKPVGKNDSPVINIHLPDSYGGSEVPNE